MPEPLTRIVGVQIGIREAMVLPVVRGPVQDGIFHRARPENEVEKSNQWVRLIGHMGKKAMIAARNA